jgi:pseudouridine synthase
MRRRSAPTHPYQDDSRGPRIQKVLADAAVGSRRACEDAVAQGRVTVNGHRIDGLPAWVNPGEDDIRVDGRRIRAAQRNVYVMLFKPRGVVTTNSDPEGRTRAIDLVEHPSKARLYPVGRLDLDASGLLLLTNDGELANRLTHPRFEMHQGYEVTVGGRVEDDAVERLSAELFPRGRAEAGEAAAQRSGLKLLKRDANRQVRRMLGTLGHPVKKLRRVRMGPLQLKGLQAGEWRELTSRELSQLREQAFATPQQRERRKRATRTKRVK